MKIIKYLIFFAIVIFSFGCENTNCEYVNPNYKKEDAAVLMYKITYAQYYTKNNVLECIQYPLDSVGLQTRHNITWDEILNLYAKRKCPDNIKNWINDSIRKINFPASYYIVQNSMILNAPRFKRDTIIFTDTLEYKNMGGVNMVLYFSYESSEFLENNKIAIDLGYW